MTRLAPVILIVLVLTGCGSSNSEEAGSPTATTPSTTDCERLSGAALTPRTSPAIEVRETMFLTGVSVEAKDCSDRVVFDFKKSAPGPGFEVSYQPAESAKKEDGSGNTIEVAGSDFLVVRISPAMTAEIVGEDVKPTYTGPRRIEAEGTRFVREVVKTGDFESQVTWVIGLDEHRPFTTNASESQLVVEIG